MGSVPVEMPFPKNNKMSIVCVDRNSNEHRGRSNNKRLVLDFPGTRTRLEVLKEYWEIMDEKIDKNERVTHFRIRYSWGSKTDLEVIEMIVPVRHFWFKNQFC